MILVFDPMSVEIFQSTLRLICSVSLISIQSLSAGQLLRELVYAKYGKQYDLSIVRRQVAGITVVALNVMWTHLDQQSFPMTEGQYMDKLNTIAEYLR